MKVYSIAPTTFQAGISIKCANNKHHLYLYNEIHKLTHEFKIPANFKTHEIELPSVSDKILERLKALGINFEQ